MQVQLPRCEHVHGGQVYIVYLDDSKQDKIHDRKFQVIGAVIVDDKDFDALEQMLAYLFYENMPEDVRDTCEFHASDLLNGNKPFDGLEEPRRVELLGRGVEVLEMWNVPIVYGAVNLNKLYGTIYATANEIDIAFRKCSQAAEDWFREQAPPNALGLLVCDNTTNEKTKRAMQNAFRQYRHLVRSSPSVRGPLAHIHDDMYFGDSKFSVGIQLADICSLLISRHLVGYEDTEPLFKRIEKLIFKGVVEPA